MLLVVEQKLKVTKDVRQELLIQSIVSKYFTSYLCLEFRSDSARHYNVTTFKYHHFHDFFFLLIEQTT